MRCHGWPVQTATAIRSAVSCMHVLLTSGLVQFGKEQKTDVWQLATTQSEVGHRRCSRGLDGSPALWCGPGPGRSGAARAHGSPHGAVSGVPRLCGFGRRHQRVPQDGMGGRRSGEQPRLLGDERSQQGHDRRRRRRQRRGELVRHRLCRRPGREQQHHQDFYPYIVGGPYNADAQPTSAM